MKNEYHAGDGGEGHKRRLVLAGLGQQVTGADIEEEAREEGQDVRQDRAREANRQRARRPQDRGRHIQQEEPGRASNRVAMGEHHGDGVHAIGEVVGDDGERDRQPEKGACLESDPDRHPIEEAVDRQADGPEHSELRLVLARCRMLVGAALVQRGIALQQKEGQVPRGRSEHHRGPGLLHRRDLRQHVEKHHAEHRARTEPEQEMQVVAEAKRGHAAQPGGEEGHKREHDSHGQRKQ